ncbi:MAG: DNA-binding protein, partial [Ottowia sp.]|nr:DNA-binding protein [Ottowia sp.]
MAKAVVTQARVFEVAQALTDQGTAPTILNVQEGIGGGSYT